MSYIDCTQQTHEWFAARCGKITASCVPYLLDRLKSGPNKGSRSQKAKDYLVDLACERLTQDASEHYVTYWMDRGREYESLARGAYEATTGVLTAPCGFWIHPAIPMAGASPDGIVGENGLLEIKCPQSSTHLEYLTAGIVPPEYEPQMMWQLACSGREWNDFVSYHPKFPKHLELFVKRLYRDEDRIKALESEVLTALEEIEAIMAKLPEAVVA